MRRTESEWWSEEETERGESCPDAGDLSVIWDSAGNRLNFAASDEGAFWGGMAI